MKLNVVRAVAVGLLCMAIFGSAVMTVGALEPVIYCVDECGSGGSLGAGGSDGTVHTITWNSAGILGSFNSNEPWTSEAYYGSIGTFFADVTGDGRADAIVVNDDGVTVRRSTGSGFDSNEPWTSEAYYGSIGTFFADVTGDGRADAIVVNDDGVTVRRSPK